MTTVSTSKSKVLSAYRNADSSGKELLKQVFEPAIFSEKVTDRIKTYEDACDELGIDPEHLPDVSGCQPEDCASIVAYCKLIIITRALNEGWRPNWQDNNELKYFPWFDLDSSLSPSRFAFGDTYCRYSNAIAGDSSRLCFHSDALATYAGKQFVDIYRDLILIY